MKKILSILLTIISAGIYAQQDPLFSQYMFNKSAVNPAYAGSREVLTLDALYRYQWVNIKGSPQTINLSVHTPLKNPHIGLGMNVYQDVLGPTLSQGALGTFSYRILFPNSRLAFGVQAGVKYSDILWSHLLTINPEDGLFISQVRNKVVPDANFGIYYYSRNLYFGFSSKQLFQNQTGVVTVNGTEEFTRLLRHFYGMAGAAFKVSDNVVFRPSMMVKFVRNSPPQLDLNASFLFAGSVWLGVSYRTERALSLMTEFNLTGNLRLGYSYDLWFNELQAYNKGSHEIRMGVDLDVMHSRMVTPRYF